MEEEEEQERVQAHLKEGGDANTRPLSASSPFLKSSHRVFCWLGHGARHPCDAAARTMMRCVGALCFPSCASRQGCWPWGATGMTSVATYQ